VETRQAALQAVIELAERLPLSYVQTCVCFDIILRSCEDYKTDKRGDTGSWCRTAAVQGLTRLLYVTFRNIPKNIPGNIPGMIPTATEGSSQIGQMVITSYGNGKIHGFSAILDTECTDSTTGILDQKTEKNGILVAFPTGSLGHSFATNSFQVHNLPEGVLYMHKSGAKPVPSLGSSTGVFETVMNKYGENENENGNKNDYGENDLESTVPVPKIISAILKQMSGKLDSVRNVAGNCLENILKSADPFIPFIPDRKVLENGIKKTKMNYSIQHPNKIEKSNSEPDLEVALEVEVAVDWSQPEIVFPFLIENVMKNSPFYFEVIFSGILVSVGGLSEQIVTESSASLLQLCTGWNDESNTEGILKIAKSLPIFYRDFKGDDRVIIPLLKTTEFLLRSGVLGQPGLRPVFSTFPTDLIAAISEEQKVTNDVGKLRTCVDLYLLLLQVEDPVRSLALKSMLLLLGHKVCKYSKLTD
jgi:Tubulin folding cofactor D C terminal